MREPTEKSNLPIVSKPDLFSSSGPSTKPKVSILSASPQQVKANNTPNTEVSRTVDLRWLTSALVATVASVLFFKYYPSTDLQIDFNRLPVQLGHQPEPMQNNVHLTLEAPVVSAAVSAGDPALIIATNQQQIKESKSGPSAQIVEMPSRKLALKSTVVKNSSPRLTAKHSNSIKRAKTGTLPKKQSVWVYNKTEAGESSNDKGASAIVPYALTPSNSHFDKDSDQDVELIKAIIAHDHDRNY